MNILNNQNGHGYVPSFKDLLKIGGFLITLPVSLPVSIVIAKVKKKKAKK